MEDITAEDCVLWCYWGKALEIGLRTSADEYRSIYICAENGAEHLHASFRSEDPDVPVSDIHIVDLYVNGMKQNTLDTIHPDVKNCTLPEIC